MTADGVKVNPDENTEDFAENAVSTLTNAEHDGHKVYSHRKAIPMSMSSRSGQAFNIPSGQGNARLFLRL
jgi:hypothetical protein